VDVQFNWWESFFHGVAVDLWVQALSPEHTRQEAAGLARLLQLERGSELLDVPCGAGRVAIELAAKGYSLTGVDQSPEFLSRARESDVEGRVEWAQRDMRDLPWRARFDGAFCVGNSFGYLDDEGNAEFLRAVARTLKPGGRFVLETPMVLENLLQNIEHRNWFQAGNVRLLVLNEYDPRRSRLDIEYTFVSDGRVEIRRGSHRAYTYRQLIELMESAGFTVAPVEEWSQASRVVTFLGTRTSDGK